jgi:hypothetical protein
MPQSTNATLPKYKRIGYVSYKYDKDEDGFDLTGKKIKYVNRYYDVIPEGTSETDANNYLPFLLYNYIYSYLYVYVYLFL